jgi:hypothetical protein
MPQKLGPEPDAQYVIVFRTGTTKPGSAAPAPRLEGVCFGAMSERDELALKGFGAGDDRAADVLRWGIGDGDLDS